jgi:DNA invertase Pin-like site-specific DNA recombinase
MENRKNVAIYMRVSSEGQKTDSQSDELHEFVARRGWTLYRAYEDKITGTSSVNARPQLSQLMSDARARQFDILLIHRLDRLFRSLKELVVTIDDFRELGIELVSMKDGIDLSTPSGRLLTQMLGSLAEFEKTLTLARCKSGIEAARRRGVKLGRPRQINPDRVLELRKQGLSLKAIAKLVGGSKTGVHKVLKEIRSESRQEILKSGNGA